MHLKVKNALNYKTNEIDVMEKQINWQFICVEAMLDDIREEFNKDLLNLMNIYEMRVNFFCNKYEENYRKNVFLALKAETQNINNQTRNTNYVNSINSDDIEMKESHNITVILCIIHLFFY